MPDISVVLPFYNADKHLNNAIQSITIQSFQNFECILVDNNSTNSSVRIAEKWVKSDNRFKLINETKQGVAYASNKGTKYAESNIIARMDADDIAFPNRLRDQFHFIKNNPQLDAIGGLVTFGGNPKLAAGLKRYIDWNNNVISEQQIKLNQFVESPIINPTAMWKKSSMEKFGYYQNGNFPEDYELWLRWLSMGARIAKTKKHVLQWNDFNGRLTRSHPSYSSDSFYTIKTKYLADWLERNNPSHPEILIWGASKIQRKRADLLKAFNIKINGYIDISLKRKIQDRVIHYRNIPKCHKTFILIYVPQPHLKQKIKSYLRDQNYIEGLHYLFAA